MANDRKKIIMLFSRQLSVIVAFLNIFKWGYKIKLMLIYGYNAKKYGVIKKE